MPKTLLTFGDSNTHGSPPIVTIGAYERFGPDIRWPCVAAKALGPDWELVEAGLPGRTTQHADPIMGPHMDGFLGLRSALESHGPIDLLTIMLGTNDLKARFAPTAEKITAGLAGLVDLARRPEMQERHGGFQILVIAPPPVLEQGPIAAEFIAAAQVSRNLATSFQRYAGTRKIPFFDASTVIAVSPQDGIHFEAEAHQRLGLAISEKIKTL